MWKRIVLLMLSLYVLIGCLPACQSEKTEPIAQIHESQARFMATVLEIGDTYALVQPLEGESELTSADQISFDTTHLKDINVQVGSIVDITYAGQIMESYPAQIQAVAWALVTDLRDIEFTDQWLQKTHENKVDNHIFQDIVIDRIYANCFFAHCVIPMPYEIKLNGTLSEDWCPGDQVAVTYENTYYDDQSWHAEADLLTIEPSTFEPDEMVCYKPVIYLYPEQETDVEVRLDVNGQLTCTYPKYENGWCITAHPDGTLEDRSKMLYNYLYWEGKINAPYDFSKGFCIPGEDSAEFLEDALERLGLTRKEANEFIVYWLPLMEQNPYNIVTFQTDAYTSSAKLEVSPAADTVIRIFMAWKACDEYVQLEPQILTAPERKGFTVVEWGGTEIK